MGRVRARWNEDKYGKNIKTGGGKQNKKKPCLDSSAVNYPPLQSSSLATCGGRGSGVGFKRVTTASARKSGER